DLAQFLELAVVPAGIETPGPVSALSKVGAVQPVAEVDPELLLQGLEEDGRSILRRVDAIAGAGFFLADARRRERPVVVGLVQQPVCGGPEVPSSRLAFAHIDVGSLSRPLHAYQCRERGNDSKRAAHLS